MGVKGICKFLSHRLFEAVIVILLIVFMPNLPPYTSISESFKVAPTKPFEGRLALNEKLAKAEIWHKGDFVGPEAFADYNGELYTGLLTGEIVKLVGNHITPVAQLGKPCRGLHEERICGRPLGMEFDSNGNLYVADAYYGIFKVNVQTGQKVQIVSPEEEIEGKNPKLFNSLTLASNGDIFWTSSSSDFSLEDGVFASLADASGRLFHYDSKTKKNKVLINNLHFANGLALSDDEEFVIVAETVRSRIHRYYLKGPKKGTKDIFIDGLPGMPDNLKSIGSDGFLVPLVIAKDEDHPEFLQMLGPFPWIRKLLCRVMGLPQLAFSYINKMYPNEFSEKAVHFIGHFSSMKFLFSPHRTTLLRVSKSGEIVDSLHTTSGNIFQIAEAHPFRGYLYLGSPWNDYIARLPLSQVGWDSVQPIRTKRDVPLEQPTTARPATTTPKPTTTTPKPTTTTPRPTTTTPRPTTTTARPTTTAAPATPKPTQAPTPKPTQAPAQKPTQAPPPKPTQPPAPKPTQAVPTPKPTQAPTVKPAQAAAPKPAQAVPKPTEAPPKAAKTTQAPPKQESPPQPVKKDVPPQQKESVGKQETVKQQQQANAVPQGKKAN